MKDKKKNIDDVIEEVKDLTSKRIKNAAKKLNGVKKDSEKLGYRFDEILFYLSVSSYRNENLSKAIYFIEKCIELQKSGPDDEKKAEAFSYYGNVLDSIGDYETALEYLNKAISIQKKFKNKTPQIFSYLRIGNVQRKFLKGADRSVQYYQNALKLSQNVNNDFLTASSLGSLGNAYLYKKEEATSAKYYARSAEIFEKIGNIHYLCTALLGLGTVERKLNRNTESINCLKKALDLLRDKKNPGLETSVSLNLAITYLNAGDEKKAMEYYNRSMSLIKKVKDKTLASKLYQGFAEAYEKNKDYKKAFEHFKKHHDLYAEIFKEESDRVNKILRLKYEKEKSEKETEIYKMKTKELQMEIENKTKELNAMASYLSQKNEFVNTLVTNIREDLTGVKLEEKIEDYIKTAIRKAESAGNLNEDFKRFENELDKFSFGFIESLSKKYPTLTRVELKICSMIKINLSTKEIANLLYLSTRTVESHKYNINKKIKLKKGQNIITFLNSI